MLTVAENDRDVLPRWGVNSPIRCHPVDPGTYSGTISWTSRHHYLSVVVPAAIAVHADILARHQVAGDTLLRWARVKSLYAQEAHSGRQVIVRPDTLAGLLQCSERTVQRCNAAARELGLELVITPGRMLSELETYAARKQGSPQRGLSTVTAFVIPQQLRPLVEHVTPTRGRSSGASLTDLSTFRQRSARSKGAPLRSAPHQQQKRRPRNHSGPVWELATELTKQVIFLHRCPPGRIAGQLSRFTDPQRTAGRRWTTAQLLEGMAAVNRRLGYDAPVRAKTAPWALLAWYLGQIDPFADHPAIDEAIVPPWCGHCASDTFRWLEDPVTHDPLRPCPHCSAQAYTRPSQR